MLSRESAVGSTAFARPAAKRLPLPASRLYLGLAVAFLARSRGPETKDYKHLTELCFRAATDGSPLSFFSPPAVPASASPGLAFATQHRIICCFLNIFWPATDSRLTSIHSSIMLSID